MTLKDAIRDFFARYGYDRTYWIAYSGGLDSSVLLSLCAELRETLPLKLHAIHINHGLNPSAQKWAQHCEAVCQHYHIDYICHSIEINLHTGDSLEEVARHKRYAAITSYLKDNDVLMTAHHEDDQAETFLLQLLRGAGTKGLAAMPVVKSNSRIMHARPLRDFTRSKLMEHARQQNLIWIDDESNTNVKLTRNFVRHHVLAPLKERWPTVATTIARSAAHCAETESLLQLFAQEKMQWVAGSKANTLSVSKLLQFVPSVQRLLLRYWIHSRQISLPSTKKIETIMQQVLLANWDRSPCVQWGNTELRRYRDDLFLLPSHDQHANKQSFQWNMIQPIQLPGIGYLHAELKQGNGLRTNVENVSVRFRQGGEMIRLAQRGTKSLKNLFQEWNVLPWERDRIPLIYVDDELAAVVGYGIAEKYSAGDLQPSYELRVRA